MRCRGVAERLGAGAARCSIADSVHAPTPLLWLRTPCLAGLHRLFCYQDAQPWHLMLAHALQGRTAYEAAQLCFWAAFTRGEVRVPPVNV